MRRFERALIFWAPPLLWFAVIYLLSDTPSLYLPKFNIPFADKLVHITVYFVLAALLVRAMDRAPGALMPYSAEPGRPETALAKLALFAIIISLCYGAADEYHQLFVAGRSCDPFDLIADCIGSFAGAAIYTAESFSWRRKPCPR
jgi:VanZ family protein